MKPLLLLAGLLLAVAARAQLTAPAPPARLAASYDGTIAGNYPIHVFFFATSLSGLVVGSYHYGQRPAELSLEGAAFARDSLYLQEYAASPDEGPTTGRFALRRLPDGSLRGTWRAADKPGPRLPVALHPVAAPGPATCAPVRVRQRPGHAPALATPDRQAAAVFAANVATEEALNEGDPGTEERTVTYAGHNLVSLLLVSEMRGASVYRSYRQATFDACTGRKLAASEEIDPRRLAAFLSEANLRLHRQLEAYLTERGPQGSDPLLGDDDAASLREQQFQLDPEQFAIQDGEVIFPYSVQYDGLSGFIGKEYAGRFGAAFSFIAGQAYLGRTSTLRRLVLPEVAAPAVPRLRR